jgi:PHD/YefM family antitoxin component YafN of YafNO toxin-antitoxin module
LQTQRFVVDRKGKKKAVIIPIKEYRELLEDLHDLAVVAERRDEPTIGFTRLKEKLKTDGLL